MCDDSDNCLFYQMKGLKYEHCELDDHMFSAEKFYFFNCTDYTLFPA